MRTGYISEIVGQTPLIKIKSLSEMTGCEIFGKAELLNPGGSVKDRAALGIINEAEEQGLLKIGDTIVEGTAGNTGIGLATIAAQRGYRCLIVMPNNQAQEKYDALNALGVDLLTVPPCPFSNENHFYHTAKRLATEGNDRFWANQFENTANFRIHYKTTGPELWEQAEGKIDAFISAVGTGGTIAGVSRFLKEKNSLIKVRMVDPFGSGLYSYIKTGQIAATGSSITEGIGIMRLTANFKEAIVDEAVQVSDQDMLSMLYHLAEKDGLLVGTSAALNVFASYQYAIEHKNSGKRILTILCDSGLRYQSKIFNPEFLKEKGLTRKPLT
ncbi:MAG: cysteine synthase A [Bdellovibrionaceae bacterium]|nr:cysteine synthase A [Pseudobdellovibrionaceae bacterium]